MVFLQQLLEFKPLTIVYVSCNVHTQARDVGWFMQVGKAAGVEYTLESLRGFDLFPQVSDIFCSSVLCLEVLKGDSEGALFGRKMKDRGAWEGPGTGGETRLCGRRVAEGSRCRHVDMDDADDRPRMSNRSPCSA